MATAAPQPNPTQAASSTAQTKPPVTIHQTAHLDPGAYVRGSHAISLDAHVLIHPRAQLISLHGPLIIGSGSVVYEKAVLGGPVPVPASASESRSSPISTDTGDTELDPLKTLIGPNTTIHPHANVHSGVTLHESSTIESHATIHAGVTVGAHAKVCAGCVVDRNVGEWEVVFGDGRQVWKRTGGEGREQVERARLKAVQVDREVTIATLRSAAKASLGRKK